MTNNIHDETFKKLMNDRKYAIAFLESYLPDKIKRIVDIQKAEIYHTKTEFLNLAGGIVNSKTAADVVFLLKCKRGRQDVLFYVHVEHHYRAEKLLPLRMAHYQLSL